MIIERSGKSRIINDATYLNGVLTDVRSVRRIEEADVIFGSPRCPDVAKVQVETRFANPPDGKPAVYGDVIFVGEAGTHEGMVDPESQPDMLYEVASSLILCGQCALAEQGVCGVTRNEVGFRYTDTKYENPSRQIAGLTFARELPIGTQASDVKCIQP